MPSPPTCAATARATGRRRSTSTRSSIWSATSSACSTHSRPRPPSSSAMTGAPAIAWHAARLRPDRFRAVVGLSVPFRPRGPVRPTSVMPRTADAQFYQLYFQEPGVAEAEFERDPRVTVRSMLYGVSGEGVAASRAAAASGGAELTPGMVPRGGGCCGQPARRRGCRPGSAKRISISTPLNSSAAVSAVPSTIIATPTATGS